MFTKNNFNKLKAMSNRKQTDLKNACDEALSVYFFIYFTSIDFNKCFHLDIIEKLDGEEPKIPFKDSLGLEYVFSIIY